TNVGQFGTLFDQLIATAALIVGLGNPTEHTIRLVTLFSPAVFGSLVAIPTYFVTKRLSGRIPALFAALVLALLPGQFLSRSLIGFADHNIAEPLFQTTAVVFILIALAIGERDRPVFEQFQERDVEGLRSVLGWSVLAGVSIALYMWVWPPGIMLVGILGVFFTVKLSWDYWRGVSPDHLGIVGAIMLGSSGLLMLAPISMLNFNAASYSLLQPLLGIFGAIWFLFMAWLARQWDQHDLSTSMYPTTITGIVVGGAILAAIVTPRLFNVIQTNVMRFVGFGTGAKTRTIREAQPLLAQGQFFPVLFGEYALTFFTAWLAAIILIWHIYTKRDNAQHLFVLLWLVFMTAAAFTQIRFNYYLAVPVAVMNGYLIGLFFDWGIFSGISTPKDLEASQIFTILTILLVIIAPLAVGINQGSRQANLRVDTAPFIGNRTAPGSVQAWRGPLQWLQENTPKVGDYGNANNADMLDYYGTYGLTNNFDYPAGSYG
ncbi:MAG: STT3 domain-containing protein, partial [Halobacteriaceae archaeon]